MGRSLEFAPELEARSQLKTSDLKKVYRNKTSELVALSRQKSGGRWSSRQTRNAETDSRFLTSKIYRN